MLGRWRGFEPHPADLVSRRCGDAHHSTHQTDRAAPSVAPNVEFFIDDLEADWNYHTRFDLIYGRLLTGSIRNWPKLIAQAFEYDDRHDPHHPRVWAVSAN